MREKEGGEKKRTGYLTVLKVNVVVRGMPTSFLNTWLWFWIMHSGFSGLCPATHALICYKERRGSVNQICKSRLIKLLIECFDKSLSVQIHGTEISRGLFLLRQREGMFWTLVMILLPVVGRWNLLLNTVLRQNPHGFPVQQQSHSGRRVHRLFHCVDLDLPNYPSSPDTGVRAVDVLMGNCCPTVELSFVFPYYFSP